MYWRTRGPPPIVSPTAARVARATVIKGERPLLMRMAGAYAPHHDVTMPTMPHVSTTRDSDLMVEMGGIEPPSTAVVMCLLRAYPMEAFYSALEFAIGSQTNEPSLS